jgi:hypothetical protein
MPPLYELAVMGAASDGQARELRQQLSAAVEPFGLRLGNEMGWSVRPAAFTPWQQTPAAVVFFGAPAVPPGNIAQVLQAGIPVLPVASAIGHVEQDIPVELRRLNCLTYPGDGPERIATALLECVGLLPRQRRVFVSYRRESASTAAVQLFNALSAKVFEVFLDTHGIAPAEDFQAALWHRLCDSDLLIMLDTQDYFDSRWTAAEFGRAMAKGISILRIGWPDVAASHRVSTASRIDLGAADIDTASGRLTDDALNRIALHLESLRARSHAVRSLTLFSKIELGITCIGGVVTGVGAHNVVHATLPDGTEIMAYPTVGVPTSVTLHDAVEHSPGRSIAIVYDHLGIHERWLAHLRWLGQNIPAARWVRASDAAWDFAGWAVP